MKKKLVALILGVLLCAMAVGGCQGESNGADAASTPTATPTSTPTPTPTEAPVKAIGTESDSESVFKVRLTNSTGLDITGISVKKTEDTEYPENMLVQDDIFVGNEKRDLYYDSGVIPTQEATQEDVAETEGDAGQKALTQGYDIMLNFSDGSSLELNSFPFDDIEEGELCVEDGVAFVKYTSVNTQQEVSTKEAQLAVKAQKEAEAAAAAEAQRQAEAAAAAEAQRQAEAEAAAAAEAQRQAEAEAAAEAQRQAEAEAAAEAQRQAEAEAAAEAQRQAEEEARRQQEQQQQQQNTDTSENDACLGDGLTW